LKYFLLEGFAHFWWVSILFAGFSAAGVAALMLERKWLPLLAVAFCLTYLVFFSRHQVMIVRNVLPVLPFLAIAAARGITITAESLRGRLKPAVYTAAGLLLSINLGWNLYAARQIKLRHHFDVFLKNFAAYLRESPDDRFLVSQKLLGALRTAAPAIAPNVVTDPATSYTKVAFLQSEGPDRLWERWPSNAWGLYEKIFGPLEVNLEAYTTFLGNERILVVTRKKFETLPLTGADLTDSR
jgi:hypothetical protein